jgi:hypothetical protein
LLLPVVLLIIICPAVAFQFQIARIHLRSNATFILHTDLALSADDLLFGFRRNQYCHINQTVLARRVANFNGYGLSRRPHHPELIVSLTSYPARIEDVTSCLYSVFTQTLKPDRIILSLSRAEFSNFSVPASVLKWQAFGLTINWVDEDLKVYLKLLPVLKQFPEAAIVTVDDDAFYPGFLLEKLWDSYLGDPRIVHASRTCLVHVRGDTLSYPGVGGRSSGSYRRFPRPNLRLVAEGIGGVLFPPGALPDEVFNKTGFVRLCPFHDDMWYFAMRVLKRVPVQIAKGSISKHCMFPRASKMKSHGLAYWNWGKRMNRKQTADVGRAYGIARILRNITG